MKKKTETRTPLKFFVGMLVAHPKFGAGLVTSVKNQNSECDIPRFGSRYKGQLNIGVSFARGGPQGWNENSNHNLLDLVSA